MTARPMTLANMRENGVRHVYLYCPAPCHHQAEIDVDGLPEDTPVPEIGRRYRCSKCGRKGVQSQPAWRLANLKAMPR